MDDTTSSSETPPPDVKVLAAQDSAKSAHLKELEDAIRDIESSEFVSVDLEFSGLFTDYTKCSDFEEYYAHVVSNVWKFCTVQLGICTAKRDSIDPSKWILSPYNFHVWPQDRRVFLSDSSSLKYLYEKGFDFQEWIRNGYDYCRLVKLDDNSTKREVQTFGLQRLIDAIIECEKPIITHNGLFDILHIYDKFIADVRNLSTPEIFIQEVHKKHFSGGVYDTKLIAKYGRNTCFHLSQGSSTTLESLRSHFLRMSNSTKMEIDPERLAAGMTQYSLKPLPSGQLEHQKAHEAGFDALATAQTFLYEVEHLTNVPKSSHISLTWRNHRLIEEVSDVLDLSIPPGRFEMKNYQAKKGREYRRGREVGTNPQKRPHRSPETSLSSPSKRVKDQDTCT